MGISLNTATEREQDSRESLKIVESAKVAGKVLAVAEDGSGALVLVREREVGVAGDDGKRSRKNGTERVYKRTASIADFAHAIEAGLLATS